MNPSTSITDVERQAAELEALRRALAASRGTFSFGIAVCNSVPLCDHLIAKVRETQPAIEVLSVPEGTVDVFGYARDHASQAGRSAMFIVDLERSIRSDDPAQAALASLNASRDLWRTHFACPVVFWLPEYAATLLSAHARDFWSRKSHQFHFAAEPLAMVEGPQAMFHGGVEWAVNLDADKKQFRIAELQQRIAEAGDPPRPEMAPHVLMWLNELGVLFSVVGRPRDAAAALERGLALVSIAPAPRQAAAAMLGNMGLVCMDLGEFRKAIEYSEKSLVTCREIGHRQGEFSCLCNLGSAYAKLGETRKAVGYFQRSLVIACEIGDRQGEENALGNLGSAYQRLGDVRNAIERYGKARAIAQEIGDHLGEENALGNLGTCCQQLGDVRNAIEYYESALAISREIGDRSGEGIALWNLAFAHYQLSQYVRATALAEQALAILTAIEHPNAEMVRRALEEWRNQSTGQEQATPKPASPSDK